MKKIGLLGGSFDPPHRGHLFISNEAKKVLQLDEIWWLVTPQNPLKISKPATYEERLQNCKQITKNFPIKILEVEKKIKSQYSYQTIKFLIQYYKNIKFFWLMGADNLVNFHKWQKWQSIFYIISIVIFRRHGYNSKALKSYAAVSAAKVTLEAITRSIALEYARFGIRANCIQAGVTNTASLRMIPASDDIKKYSLLRNPFDRLTLPEDVANVVYLLTKDEAEWINGTIIPVDGGEHISL